MAMDRLTSTGRILRLVTTESDPEAPDQVVETFKQAMDTARDSKAVIIITLGDDIDVFSSHPTVLELVGMHRIFSDHVEEQVRGNST